MSTELETNNEVVLDDDLVEIRKKNESVITRNLGNPKPRARKMKAFETVVWPALEKIGWRKEPGELQLDIGLTFFIPPDVKALEMSIRGQDYFCQIKEVLTYLESGKPEEVSAFQAYVEEVKKLESEQQQSKAVSKRKNPVRQKKEETKPPVDLSWKYGGRNFPKKTSQVGPEYQVSEIPTASTDLDPNGSDEYCELFWKPEYDLDPVISQKLQETPSNKKARMMERVHRRKAGHLEEGEIPVDDGSDWSEELKERYNKTIFRYRKNFSKVSAALGIPLKTCLAYYYGTFKTSDNYRLLKVVCEEEQEDKAKEEKTKVDQCAICDDGGNLLICDGCEGEYHMRCLRPALKEVPEGYWECDECVNRKMIQARDFLVEKSGLFNSISDDENEYAATNETIDVIRDLAKSISMALNGDQGERFEELETIKLQATEAEFSESRPGYGMQGDLAVPFSSSSATSERPLETNNSIPIESSAAPTTEAPSFQESNAVNFDQEQFDMLAPDESTNEDDDMEYEVSEI